MTTATVAPEPRTIDLSSLRVGSGSVLDIETYRSTYGRATHDTGATSTHARRRDRRAAVGSVSGYTRESVHLARAYDHALGWALTYGIPVYVVTATSVHLRALGSLVDDITAFEAPLIEAQRIERARREMEAELDRMLDEMDSRATAR